MVLTVNVRNHPQQQIHLPKSRLLIPVALGSYPGGQCLGRTPPPPPGHSCVNKWPGVLVKWRFLICPSRRCWNFVFLNITICVCVCVCVYICIHKKYTFCISEYEYTSGYICIMAWDGKLIRLQYDACVCYGTVIISSAELWRIDTFKLWCWRRILRIP